MNFLSFFNKLKNPIVVDIHSHLLPGIDDGVKTLQESINIIKRFQLLGYSKLITTPHIMQDIYPNNREIISEKLSDVQAEIEKHHIDITLEASAEYYLDSNFLQLIEDDELIPFMKHYILFETPTITAPFILEVAIKALLEKGYIPVLAHPERYIYLHQDINKYKELKAMGVLFQVNIKSLLDSKKPIYKIALQLINSGLVDFIGSDTHRIRDIQKLEKVTKSRLYKKLLEKNKIINNL